MLAVIERILLHVRILLFPFRIARLGLDQLPLGLNLSLVGEDVVGRTEEQLDQILGLQVAFALDLEDLHPLRLPPPARRCGPSALPPPVRPRRGCSPHRRRPPGWERRSTPVLEDSRAGVRWRTRCSYRRGWPRRSSDSSCASD